ncbi:MAG: hypothetical protein AMXMBFR61_19440 [Fimbriimonadales bacterium]
MDPRLDQLDSRFRDLVVQRLGTYYRRPFSKAFLDSLPRKIWFVRVPKDWNIGQYDWTGRPEAQKLSERYDARLALGITAHCVGFGAAFAAMVAGLSGAGPELAVSLTAPGMLVGILPWILELVWRRRLRRRVTQEELRLALAEEPLNRAERRYLAILNEIYLLPPAAHAEGVRVLESVNEVMAQYRELERKRVILPSGPDDAAIARNEAEIEKVRSAMENETDAYVLAAHRERIAALEATNENLRRVGTLGRRVAAQMRAMETLLEGATAGLARMRLAEAAGLDDDTRHLADRLHQMASESSSLEAALEEMRELREGL